MLPRLIEPGFSLSRPLGCKSKQLGNGVAPSPSICWKSRGLNTLSSHFFGWLLALNETLYIELSSAWIVIYPSFEQPESDKDIWDVHIPHPNSKVEQSQRQY